MEEESDSYACSNEMREGMDGLGCDHIDDTTVTKVRLLLTYIFLSLVIAFICIRRLCHSLTAARPKSG